MTAPRYVPYDELAGMSNIIVDGTGTHGTSLVLSHWVGSGTREEFADDLSTQIVFRYLDRSELHVEADAVSNNHFDEDGLCGIWAIANPEQALARREQLIDVASAGDFATWQHRDSARVAMTLMAYADPERSPLPAQALNQSYPRQSAALHHATLPLLPDMLDHTNRFREHWQEEDARLEATLVALADGRITIQEHPQIDCAIVRIDPAVGTADEPAHTMGIHNATQCLRILTVRGDQVELRYRYESWVDFRSRPVMPRVDVRPLAAELSEEEDGGEWIADDAGDLSPALRPVSGRTNDPLRAVERITAYLAR